jgi:steroid delta-isomerase-like uncharacterized protein
MDARETIRKWRDSMNEGRLEEYLGVYSPDAVLETPIARVQGRQGVKEYDGSLASAIKDSVLKTPSMIVSGDTAAVEWVWSGKQTGEMVVSGAKIPATNRSFSLYGTSILHFDSKGLIAKERRYYDVRTWLEQLGLK